VAGVPGDARAADRRRARGRRPAAVTARRFSTYAALATIAVAVALMLVGLFVGAASTTQRLLGIGLGTLLLFVGVAMLTPRLVPPLVRVLGWPGVKIGGTAGTLAQRNAARNPGRTAWTAQR